jgi:hypothetical protein
MRCGLQPQQQRRRAPVSACGRGEHGGAGGGSGAAGAAVARAVRGAHNPEALSLVYRRPEGQQGWVPAAA